MRLATEHDSDKLTNISRLCFPDMLRWRGPKSYGRKWWRMLINSSYCDVWMCVNEGREIGYIELDLDKTQSLYHNDWQIFQPDFLTKLYMLIFNPKLFLMKSAIKLKQHPEKKSSLTKKDIAGKQSGTSDEKCVCWVRRSAILPQMQRKGFATKMYEFCFKKAAELGYDEVRVMVERNNFKSLGMVKKLGFEVDKEREDAFFLRKKIQA